MRIRHSISQPVVRALADYRWHFLVVAGIGAFGLGCVGYYKYLKNPTFSDVAYASMQLFFGTTMAQTHLPTTLNIARFLAFIVTGWAGVTALGALFADRLRQMRIPWMRGHVVVCGLGYAGSVFVRHLWESGARAVVIEADANNPHIDLCRGWGVPVIVGDAQRSEPCTPRGRSARPGCWPSPRATRSTPRSSRSPESSRDGRARGQCAVWPESATQSCA